MVMSREDIDLAGLPGELDILTLSLLRYLIFFRREIEMKRWGESEKREGSSEEDQVCIC